MMKPRAVVSKAVLCLFLSSMLGSRPAVPEVRQPGPCGTDAAKLVALLRNNSFREAEKLAAKLLADPASGPATRAVCGLALLKAGRIEKAEKVFGEVLALSPDNPEAHFGLGRVARVRNNRDAAIAHLRRAVPSEAFFEEALRQLWRTVWDRGPVDELLEVRALIAERYGRESLLPPSYLGNALAQIRGLEGKRLFEMEGRFESLRVPLVTAEPHVRIRMISLRLNGRSEYLFDIDSASADFLTVSPLLAEELGLARTGGSTATGVGTAAAPVRFAVLDKVELGPVAFRNVPVMVSDIHTFRGLKKGLLGTAFLKRFNATIDVEAKVMDLSPLDRPDLLAARIDRRAVAADVPLLLFDQTVVEASFAGAPPALCILDTAAATNLVDRPFFAEHIEPKLDPARIVPGGIRGAGGDQRVNRVDGVPIALGGLVFEGQQINEFAMAALNEIPGRYAAGLVGNPLLWPYRVHLDFKNGRLILERYAGQKVIPSDSTKLRPGPEIPAL